MFCFFSQASEHQVEEKKKQFSSISPQEKEAK